MAAARCHRAAADVARRALADGDRLPRVEAWFRRTAGERGYDKSVLDEVWETVASFGAYGFCRARTRSPSPSRPCSPPT